jgi:ADP-ribose pyrophosphatase
MYISSTDTLLSKKFLNFQETVYEDRHGKEKRWNWVQRPGNQDAIVIAATVDDKLVLIKEFRVPLRGYVYELPAGLIDPFESAQESGIREFHEETGLIITRVLGISPLVYNSPGLTNEAVFLMFAEAEGTVSDSSNQSSEDITTMTYSRAAVQDLMNDPSVRIGAKAYLVFRDFVKYGKIF